MDGFETGVDFNFTYAPGVSLEQMIGFEMAGEFWSQYLADDVSINIFVEMTDYLPENVVGGALPGIEDNVRYGDYRESLERDITSGIDQAVNYYQQDTTDSYTAYFSSKYTADGYQVDNNEYMQMTRANAKALDLIDPDDTGYDGYILMRDLDGVGDGDLNDIQWSYNYEDDVIPEDSLDFLSVAIHELGHVLGFVSGLDQSGWQAEKLALNSDNEEDYYSNLVGTLDNPTSVDMMRYSEASYEMSGDQNWIDFSIGGNPYLSFTGAGGTPVAYFATGENTDLGGDGYQASHWAKEAEALGIMDPVLATGQRREITMLDVMLFDAIGWDLKPEVEDVDLTAINLVARDELAEAMITTAQEQDIWIPQWSLRQWADGNDYLYGAAYLTSKILTPEYVDLDNNGYDDRGEKLNEMVVNSGEVYEWGWGGFWWGWGGFWWGWGGFWQSTDNLAQDGFWQNFSWQTITLDSEDSDLAVDEETGLDGVVLVDNLGNDDLVKLEKSNQEQGELLFDLNDDLVTLEETGSDLQPVKVKDKSKNKKEKKEQDLLN